MPRRPVTRQAPPLPRSPGSIAGHFTAVLENLDALTQRLGTTLASIFMLTMLALTSIYFMRDAVFGVIAIYLIAVLATVFVRLRKL
jgi:hypothetical protein